MKRRRTGERVSLMAAAAIAVMIFCFSAQGGGDSSRLSEGLTKALLSLFVPGFGGMSMARQLAILEIWGHAVRKAAHFTEFAMFAAALTAYRHFRRDGGQLCGRIAPPWAVATAYACTDELHQMFVDGRTAMLTDVLIDSVGALTGVLACLLVIALRRRRRRAK